MRRLSLVIVAVISLGSFCWAEDDYINDSYQYQQDVYDRAAEKWDQYIRDEQDYVNPDTGETVTLSDDYNNAWQSGDTSIQTDSYGYNPNTDPYSGSSDWTQLEPVE